MFFSHGKTNSFGVAIEYFGTKKIDHKVNDTNGLILLLGIKVDDANLALVKLCNANTETEQLTTLTELNKMISNVGDISDKYLTMGGKINWW